MEGSLVDMDKPLGATESEKSEEEGEIGTAKWMDLDSHPTEPAPQLIWRIEMMSGNCHP